MAVVAGPAGGDGTGGPFGNPLTNDDPAGASRAWRRCARCTASSATRSPGLPWHVAAASIERLPLPGLDRGPAGAAASIAAWSTRPRCGRSRLSAVEFWAQWISAALWFGDGYVYVPVRDEAGAPKPPLWQLHPQDVTIDGGTYWVGDMPLPAGLGDPPARHAAVYGRPRARRDHTHGAELGLAGDGARLRGGRVHDRGAGRLSEELAPIMTPEQADDAEGEVAGAARRREALDRGAERDDRVHADLRSRRWTRSSRPRVNGRLRDIALAFGVPAYMLGVPGDSHVRQCRVAG